MHKNAYADISTYTQLNTQLIPTTCAVQPEAKPMIVMNEKSCFHKTTEKYFFYLFIIFKIN